jgi:hypothetical protein
VASPIIAAIRQQRHLKESVLHTAQELAHRASIYGTVHHSSNAYMAEKCHCSKRTFQRHVVCLVKAHILKKTVIKMLVKVKVGDRYEVRLHNEINVYTFTLPWKKLTESASSQAPMDRMSTKLPYRQDTEKAGSLREDLHRAEKGVRFCTPGTEAYRAALQHLERLRALVPMDPPSVPS